VAIDVRGRLLDAHGVELPFVSRTAAVGGGRPRS